MRARRGYTLVEVVVAMLLAAVMITSVFTVALSNKRSNLKQDSQAMAQASSQSVLKMLSAYVTADWTQSVVPGPNSRGTNSWSLDGDDYEDVTRPGAWALAPGSHTIKGKSSGLDPDGLLPRLRGDPYKGTLTYCVQWLNCPQCTNNASCVPGSCTPPLAATCQPSITVTADWIQP
jgi:prepilin-type N-terminal cleavage/methylation domain-containing protein